MKRTMPLVLILSMLFAACGDDSGTPDATPPDGAVEDGAVEDGAVEDGAVEDGAVEDATLDGSRPDATPEDAMAEGGSSCTRTIPDLMAGVCDGRGVIACTNWALENGGPTAVARCVRTEERCARADMCDGSDCTCGGGPECEDDQMCVSGVAGFTCVCLREE